MVSTLRRSAALGVAAAALVALGWFVAGLPAARGPAALGLPVFLLIAGTVAVVDHRARRRAPVYVPMPAGAIPAQRAATVDETLSTGAVAGVAARR